MKIYKKWLVMGTVNGKSRVATSFNTKKEAEVALTLAMNKVGDMWEDSLGQKFFIEKNVKEYK